MRGIFPITGQYQHFVADLRAVSGAIVTDRLVISSTTPVERESIRLREIYLHCHPYERTCARRDQRNGFY